MNWKPKAESEVLVLESRLSVKKYIKPTLFSFDNLQQRNAGTEKNENSEECQELEATTKDEEEYQSENLLDNVDGEACSESVESALGTMTEEDIDENASYGLGRLRFTVGYDATKSSLNVSVHEADNLQAKDANGTSNPYVKVMVMESFYVSINQSINQIENKLRLL